jgi:Cytochrome c7 and related cytochrome c
MKRLAFFALALLGTASCGAWWLRGATREAFDPIKIPHDVHARAQVECVACHDAIWDAKTLDGAFLPPEDTCLQCHRAEKEKGNCNFCHTNVKRAAPYPPPAPAIQLSHADHLARVKDDCSACHKKLPNPVRTTDLTPTMNSCLSCHEHRRDYDAGRCRACHLDLKRYPLAPVAAFSHAGDFVHEHARPARAADATCAECHEQTFCADCHARTVATKIETKMPERVGADFIHRDDFLGRHAIEARADEASCARCHGESFCQSCHTAQNLTPLGANPRDPHPPGWSFPGSVQFHGPAARRDIASCASCHDQGARSVCVDCHRSGGIGGNPHPPGWPHRRDEIARNNMCLVCH